MATTPMYLIYGLYDPQDGMLRYIGKSMSGIKRAKSHGYPSHLRTERGYKVNWIKSLKNIGLDYKIAIIEILDSPEQLYEHEIFWIKYFKNMGFSLTNASNGGAGNLGWRVPPETKKKMSESSKNSLAVRNNIQKIQKLRIGSHHSDESKTRIAKGKGSRPIIDQNGLIYSGVGEASRATGVSRSVVKGTADRLGCSNNGIFFRYLNDPRIKHTRLKKKKKPIIDNLGNIYKTIPTAAKELNLDAHYICRVLRGERKSTGGRSFKFLEENFNG